MARIAILIPCYNEEQTIVKVVQDFREAVPEAVVYVYDNNSTDASVELVRALAERDDHVVLRHEYKQGKGNVIRSMFRDIEADCYVMSDGDDTYPATFARELIEPILEGRAEMAIGDRLSSTYFTENKRPFHNLGNVLMRKLINGLFGSKVTDIMTGYRAFTRSFVKGFPVLSKGFEVETEMTIHAVDKAHRIVEVPVTYRDRREGSESKLNTYSDGAKVISTAFRLFKEYKPMAFFGWLSALFMVAALALFIPVLVGYFSTGEVARFPTLIVLVALGIISVLSFMVGVILDVEVKKHKQLHEILTNHYLSLQRGQ